MNTILSTLTNANANASLEEILTRITNANNGERDTFSLAQWLKTNAKDSILASLIPGHEHQDPLGLLNPATNTLGYLYILSSRVSARDAPPVTTEQLLAFGSNHNPDQAQLAPERMAMLAKGIWKRAESAKQPSLAIPPLRAIVSRYPSDRAMLTPIHPIFLNACLLAMSPMSALPILSTPLTAVHPYSLPPQHHGVKDTSGNPSDWALTYMDSLLYHYLGGVLMSMLKRWTLAEHYFEVCATAPTLNPNTVSALQVEALKKLFLIQLIAHGKTRSLPKYAPPAVLRPIKGTPYTSLMKFYPYTLPIPAYNPSEKDIKAFQVDGNYGLVKQALAQAVRWRIRELTATYVALTLEEVCTMAGVGGLGGSDEKGKGPSKEKAIEEGRTVFMSMIERGEISASLSIDQASKTETVTFHSSGEEDISPPDGRQMQELLANALREGEHLTRLDRELIANKDFLTKALKSGRDDAYPDDQMELYTGREGWDDNF